MILVCHFEFSKLASAFDILYSSVHHSISDIDISLFKEITKPHLVEIFLPSDYSFSPKLSSRLLEDGTLVSARLEDMAPFLDREEFSSLAKSAQNL